MLFQCNQTGNTIEVKDSASIASMLEMPHYTKVEDKKEEKQKTLTLKKDKK